MNGFCFHANRLNEILYLLNFFAQQGEKWIFRGQSNAEWPLKSSLERAFEQFNVDDIDNKIRAEQHIIEMGDRTLRPYVPSFIEDKLDLLAFIQHFVALHVFSILRIRLLSPCFLRLRRAVQM